jgi:hypothetical protein
MKKTFPLIAGVMIIGAVLATAQDDPIAEYWNSVNDVTNRFAEKLQEAQPYLEWLETKDEAAREERVWEIDAYANDLRKIKAEFDGMPLPQGFGVSHGIISSAMDLYITGISRVAEGIRMNYTKIFNGGIGDIETANDLMDQGYQSLANDMAAAGYTVE